MISIKISSEDGRRAVLTFADGTETDEIVLRERICTAFAIPVQKALDLHLTILSRDRKRVLGAITLPLSRSLCLSNLDSVIVSNVAARSPLSWYLAIQQIKQLERTACQNDWNQKALELVQRIVADVTVMKDTDSSSSYKLDASKVSKVFQSAKASDLSKHLGFVRTDDCLSLPKSSLAVFRLVSDHFSMSSSEIGIAIVKLRIIGSDGRTCSISVDPGLSFSVLWKCCVEELMLDKDSKDSVTVSKMDHEQRQFFNWDESRSISELILGTGSVLLISGYECTSPKFVFECISSFKTLVLHQREAEVFFMKQLGTMLMSIDSEWKPLPPLDRISPSFKRNVLETLRQGKVLKGGNMIAIDPTGVHKLVVSRVIQLITEAHGEIQQKVPILVKSETEEVQNMVKLITSDGREARMPFNGDTTTGNLLTFISDEFHFDSAETIEIDLISRTSDGKRQQVRIDASQDEILSVIGIKHQSLLVISQSCNISSREIEGMKWLSLMLRHSERNDKRNQKAIHFLFKCMLNAIEYPDHDIAFIKASVADECTEGSSFSVEFSFKVLYFKLLRVVKFKKMDAKLILTPKTSGDFSLLERLCKILTKKTAYIPREKRIPRDVLKRIERGERDQKKETELARRVKKFQLKPLIKQEQIFKKKLEPANYASTLVWMMLISLIVLLVSHYGPSLIYMLRKYSR